MTTVKKAAPRAKQKDEPGTVAVASVYVADPESGDITVYERGNVIPAEQRKLVGDHIFAADDEG